MSQLPGPCGLVISHTGKAYQSYRFEDQGAIQRVAAQADDSSVVNVAVPSIVGGLHTSLGTAAWAVSGYLLGLACGLAATPWLARRYGTLSAYGAALLAASTLWAAAARPGDPLWVTTALLCGRGAALGLTVQPLVMALLGGLPASAMPDANTLFNMAERLSGSFGIALLATLCASRAAATGSPVTALHDCALVLTVAAAVGAVAAACNHGVSANDAGSAQGGRHGRRHRRAAASQRADQAVPAGKH